LILPVAVLLPGCNAGAPNSSQDSEAFGGAAGEEGWTLGLADNGDLGTSDSNAQTLAGYVHDPSGLPLDGVEVETVDGSISYSDAAGRFTLPELASGARVVMTFYKPGYATTQGSAVAVDGGVNFFSQTMAPVDLAIDFAAEDGANFEIDGTHSFALPSQTILREDGSAHDGNVHLEVTVWDRTKALDDGGEFLASPGNGRGIAANGDEVLLYSFGMFQIEMTDDDGEPLRAGPGVNISVDVPADSGFQVGETVPYWSYDPEQGTWAENGAGRIAELGSGQQVWEFEPTDGLPLRNTTTQRRWRAVVTGNPDYPIITWVEYTVDVSATAQGQISSPQGELLSGATVRVIASDQTYMIRTTTDASGNFSVQVPPQVSNPSGPNGRSLFIEVDYVVADQPKLWRQDSIDAPGIGGIADFGGVVTGRMTCLAGTVVDASGAPVAGLNIATPHAGNAITDEQGSFCAAVPLWQPSTLYALPSPSSAEGFEPVKFRPEAGDAAGNCETGCPNVVQLTPYETTTCASGLVFVGGEAADGILVEAFDNRFPNAPVFSAHTSAGEYCVSIPVGLETTVRIGAGDNSANNACASASLNPSDSTDTCDDGLCEWVPTFECGQ
jgi:hypothetical protein